MADPTRTEEEELPRTERQGMPGKTPGQAEGEDAERREPPVHEPGKTAGTAEGGPEVSTDEAPAERSPDPNRLS